MNELNEKISKLFQQNHLTFSDIHIESGEPLRVRVPRGLVPLDKPGEGLIASKQMIVSFLSPLAGGEGSEDYWQQRIEEGGGQFDGRITMDFGIMRIALFNTGGGFGKSRNWGLVLRVLPAVIQPYEELGLPKQLLKWFERPNGLIIFTGITGSGKSTSMASAINYINKNFNFRIIQLEDPIEYLHENIASMISQRERKHDFATYPQGVEQAMRQDPDVIVIGEVKDLPSLRAAVGAALTGHLVITSLHTRNAAETVSRIIEMFPAEEKESMRNVVAQLLVGVVSQKLLPSVDGKKRHLATEIMSVTWGVSNLIREDKVQQIPNEVNKLEPTMHLLNTSLAVLASKGLIDEETARAASYDLEGLENHMDAEFKGENEHED